MKYSIIFLMLFTINAYATDRNPATNNFLNQVQAQEQYQSQKQSTSTVLSTSYGTKDFPVNTAWSYASHPTAPCKAGWGAGAQGVKVGVSFSGTTDDLECDLRETADAFMRMGLQSTAVEILCQSKHAKQAKICQPPKP